MGSIIEARERLSAGDFEDAVAIAGALLEANPNDLHAWYITASAVHEIGDTEAATVNFKSLVDALAGAGEPIFAIFLLKKLEKMGEDTSEILNTLASLYSSASDRIDELPFAPPPIPPVTAVVDWETSMGRSALVEKAKAAMAGAWGELFTREPSGKLPFVPILSSLRPDDFKLFVATLTLLECGSDQVIVEQGTKGDGFYIVAFGEVGVTRRGNDGSATLLAKLGPGAFFGEMALVSNARRAAEVKTRESSFLLRAGKLQIETLSTKAPEIGRVLIAFCHARMLENLIRISPVLSPVPAAKRPSLIGAFTTDYKKAGKIIVQEGARGDGLYLIVSGEVIVTKKEDDEAVLLATLGPGDIFGEISLLMQKPSTATVRAKENTALLFLSTEHFMTITETYPEFLKGAFDIALKREAENISVLASDAGTVDELVLL